VRCTQSDFLVHVKRWMLKFELTHKCTLIQLLGGGVYVYFRVSDVTYPGGMLCSPYQPFVVVLFFKSKYLPLL